MSETLLHLYDGNPDALPNPTCAACGGPPKNGVHYTNGGVVCDMVEGACACGAWHHGMDEHRARGLT